MSDAQRPASSPRSPLADASFLRDPYPAYRELREGAPIHWSEDFFYGAWVVARHADVEGVLRDPRFSARRTGGWVNDVEAGEACGHNERRAFQALFARAMLFLDGHDHARLRRVMSAFFRPSALQTLAPCIERIVAERLDAADAVASADPRAGFDFMHEVARPLPATVIAEMMGIAPADRSEFIGWSHDLAEFIGAQHPDADLLRRAGRSLLRISRSFEALLGERRRLPGDDIVSRLLEGAREGSVQPGAELLAQCAMLLFAGHETTRNLLGNGLHALLSHPDQMSLLQRDPSLIPGAVRELLRYDSPVQYTGRRVAVDLELHGARLRRGDLVVALIAAANRDPRRHAHPDRLDVTRPNPGSLAFGHGAHVCLGAALTLMEAQAVFAQVLRRWPDLHLMTADSQWNGNAVYRGLKTLRVRTRHLLDADRAGNDRRQAPLGAMAS